MGIKFYCDQCGYRLNVKADLAGKRGICPKCQAKLDIPLASTHKAQPKPQPASIVPEEATAPTAVTALAGGPIAQVSTPAGESSRAPAISPPPQPQPQNSAADPIAESPQSQWYVLPKGAANPYGPAQGDLMRSWIQEGRVGGDSMVWRQDWPQWQPASTVFPQLAGPPRVAVATSTPVVPAAVMPGGAAAVPMAAAHAAPKQQGLPASPAIVVEAGPSAGSDTRSSADPYVSRRKSDTGSLVAIVVLLLVSIVLAIVFYEVVIKKKHLEVPPASAPASGPEAPAE